MLVGSLQQGWATKYNQLTEPQKKQGMIDEGIWDRTRKYATPYSEYKTLENTQW